jgi:hypothetical protein
MKSLTLRSSVALACALSLAACGGGSGNLQLYGTVVGQTMAGLVLINKSNGEKLAVSPGTSTFYFTKLLANDENYDVAVDTNPDNAVCTVTSGQGKTGSFSVGSVFVSCITKTHALGGTITGHLDTNGLVLVNGADKVTVNAGATSFDFAAVGEGSPYGVTILTQPLPRTCRVIGGVGTMAKADIKNIQVDCN